MHFMKTFKLTCLFVLFCVVAQGQSSKKDEGIKLGFKTGVNASQFLSSDDIDQSMRYGFHVGLISEIIISDKASFQPELLYSSQGNMTPDVKNKFEYINLPLVLRYYAKQNLSVDLGPQLGFLVNSFSKGNEGNTKLDDQNSFDFALCGGATYDLENNFFVQARYNLGLINISKEEGPGAIKYQNSVVQFSVGYYF
jgi:hypothetical protein